MGAHKNEKIYYFFNKGTKIREQILSVPWYNNKSDYGTAIFIFYVINEMYGYN